ncbi:chemokine XC receptor 1 [Chanos chanos]|uniref:Chemokine XC receptor 1 n=1 Tax=Chanos chanos TaxID=29144 RepID=A0A6J2VE44_CHACN|nr:chemokine XC receptor 1-like [Chanos chanos]
MEPELTTPTLEKRFDYDIRTTEYYSYDYNETTFEVLERHEGLVIAGIYSVVCYSLIISLSLPGNIYLLWVLLWRVGLKSVSNLLLLHLTISDILFTLTLIPWAVYYIHGWVFGRYACKVLSGSILLGLYSYMLFLMAITIHRYTVVVHAARASTYRDRGRLYTHLTCAAAWTISILCCLTEAVYSETINDPDGILCELCGQPDHLILLGYYIQIAVFFLFPFAIMSFCYVRMTATIQQTRLKQKQQAVWLMFSIVVGFFICWAPYNIVVFIETLQMLGLPVLTSQELMHYAFYITHTLAYCHCCLNPLMHVFGADKFRHYLPQNSLFTYFSRAERGQKSSSCSAPRHSLSYLTNV